MREYLDLKVSHIFKHALGDDDVEAFIGKPDRHLKKVGFNQVRRRVVYSYVNTVILDIRPKERPQGPHGPTTNIEQHASPALRDPIYNSRGLLEAIVGSAVFYILLAPKIFLIKRVAGAIHRNEPSAACRVGHDHSSRRTSSRAHPCSVAVPAGSAPR